MPLPTSWCTVCSCPPSSWTTWQRDSCQATGNMRTPGVCMVLMCALDVVFNTLLIFPTGTIRLGALSLPGAGLGTAGAALGTGLAELAVGLYLLYFVLAPQPGAAVGEG